MRLVVGARACPFFSIQKGGHGWRVDGKEGGRFQKSGSKHALVNVVSIDPRKPQGTKHLGEMPRVGGLRNQGGGGGMLHDGWHLANPSLVQEPDCSAQEYIAKSYLLAPTTVEMP
eukprot:2230840-Pyramimonas_sp.AAC.1